jgi:cryptochrome
VEEVIEAYRKRGKTPTQPPTSLLEQLLFHDMYFGAQAALGAKYAQTLGNRAVRFIPWHLPSVYDETTGLANGSYSVDSEVAERWLKRWKMGLTGFPWIDASMPQLKEEGWIHHLGRHAVACFLTRVGVTSIRRFLESSKKLQ